MRALVLGGRFGVDPEWPINYASAQSWDLFFPSTLRRSHVIFLLLYAWDAARRFVAVRSEKNKKQTRNNKTSTSAQTDVYDDGSLQHFLLHYFFDIACCVFFLKSLLCCYCCIVVDFVVVGDLFFGVGCFHVVSCFVGRCAPIALV